jgi:DNA (cytosine-5)-methyltransferase 1
VSTGPTPTPRLLDAFCGEGGAAKGYADAGFEVVGVDSDAKAGRRFPFEFIHGDALEYIAYHGHEFDLIHASPPCQRKSAMSNCRPGLAETYPNLIRPARMILDAVGVPYVIENVEGSDVRADVLLCGTMFGLPLYRHRLFESNIPLAAPLGHPRHLIPASKAGHWTPGTIMSVSGHVSPIEVAREAMGIDWMTRDGLAESIPPAYTYWLGAQLLAELSNLREAS